MNNEHQVDETTKELFISKYAGTVLDRNLKLSIYHKEIPLKQSIFWKVLVPNKDLREYEGEISDVVVLINDNMFIRLDESQQNFIMEKIIGSIDYNPEKDTIRISKPDFNESTYMLSKYKYEFIEAVNLSLKGIDEQLKEFKD